MDHLVMKNNLAVIPARGGSKRIPRKNILDLDGMPMITYTIQAALASRVFDDVIVSTDDEEIANIALEHGASVPFFRELYADDYSTVSDVVIHVLNQMESVCNKQFKTVTQLMPNCPLRKADQIIRAMEFFEQGGHHFQISCFKYGWMNPWWMHQLDINGKATPVFSSRDISRSQDLPEVYCPTGAIWVASVPELLKYRSFYGPEYRFLPMHWKYAVDIDDYDDLEMVKVLMRMNS